MAAAADADSAGPTPPCTGHAGLLLLLVLSRPGCRKEGTTERLQQVVVWGTQEGLVSRLHTELSATTNGLPLMPLTLTLHCRCACGCAGGRQQTVTPSHTRRVCARRASSSGAGSSSGSDCCCRSSTSTGTCLVPTAACRHSNTAAAAAAREVGQRPCNHHRDPMVHLRPPAAQAQLNSTHLLRRRCCCCQQLLAWAPGHQRGTKTQSHGHSQPLV